MSEYVHILDKFTNHVLEAVERMDRDVVRIEEDIKKYQEDLKKSNNDVLSALHLLKLQIVKIEADVSTVEELEKEVSRQKELIGYLFSRVTTTESSISSLREDFKNFKEDIQRDYSYLNKKLEDLGIIVKKIEDELKKDKGKSGSIPAIAGGGLVTLIAEAIKLLSK